MMLGDSAAVQTVNLWSVTVLTPFRTNSTFAAVQARRGTVTGWTAHRETNRSRGFCLSPTLIAVISVAPFRGSAPQFEDVTDGKGQGEVVQRRERLQIGRPHVGTGRVRPLHGDPGGRIPQSR